ncbi:MAG: hypothetical protein QOE77_3034 [Blastocatellia bacterium]|nr:hypothetical protein [Blastocatellia bacterium]
MPFANEDETQEFVEGYFERVGLTVIASSMRPGLRLLDIDILAVDYANTFIIECKWNLIDTKTIHQLVRYRNLLESNQALLRKRLADNGVQFSDTHGKPVLVAIGYQYQPIALSEAQAESIVCLTYTYHGLSHQPCPHVSPPCKTVESHLEGEVSIQVASFIATTPHPIVCKRRILAERAKGLPGELQNAFWVLDDKIRELSTVTAVYGKNPDAYYSVSGLVFAEARMNRKAQLIRWNSGLTPKWKGRGQEGSVEMFGVRDVDKVFKLVRKAYAGASAGGK